MAAVVLLAFPGAAGWHIPLTVRSESMADHGGQVSLPGGVVEVGESSSDCALRELEEELGVSREGLRVLRELSTVWVFASNFLVTPHVAIAPRRPDFCPNPAEVAEIIELPLTALSDPACRASHLLTRHALTFRAPHITCGGHKIWGATYLILAEFAAHLADLA